ncbi:MAG: RelA/SpoT family protein [Candidatus Promineifilaceae bacterium]|jgi:RelA/SpoT family (p)ppGpp synthetase
MARFVPITLNELLDLLPYSEDGLASTRLKEAYGFIETVHGDRLRDSGESYVEHDLVLAQSMLELDVDTETLVACLLHDSLLPHTGIKVSDLEKKFGPTIASIVSGLNNLQAYASATKLKTGQNGDIDIHAAEVVRQAILSIIEGDIRVILIRMADCLVDLRFAGSLDHEKQLEIAGQAMHIYAPLANRLGIWRLKWELEDLAFRYLDPENYHKIANSLSERRSNRLQKIEEAAVQLQKTIDEMGLNADVSGRSKHIYSIYRKMNRKNIDFERIYDVEALRVILEPRNKETYAKKNQKERAEEDRSLCYQVLGAVHSLWQPIPKEFDDYIASPKANGYRSLHTAVIDTNSGQKFEVQIRTVGMHEEAEKGIAAHWAYKEEGERVSASAQRRIQNLRDLLATLQDSVDGEASDGLLEKEMLAERIYAFTPNGDVIELPSGSTPIDFAYQIHTQVGNRCKGARVNGKMVSLDYKLRSGDKVEIITAKRESPRRDWMNASLGYTGTARTRSKVRQWFRQQERGTNIQQGRSVVERELKRLGLSETFSVEEIAQALKYDDVKEFLARVGFGDIQSKQISGAIRLMEKSLKPEDEELIPLLLPEKPKKPQGLTVLGVSGLATKIAGCCNPIPPEPIVGYITRGHGVTIHRQDCKQLEAIKDRERIIKEVDWGIDTETFPIPIVVTAYRRANLIDEMSNILRGQRINAPRTKTVTSDSTLKVYLVAEVNSLDQLNWLLHKFEGLPNVIEARRQRWS